MTADFRSLCARFVEAVDLLCGSGDSPARPGERLILATYVDGLEELAAEAREVLTAYDAGKDQQPIELSDEELLACHKKGCWQEGKKMVMEEGLPASDSTATAKAFTRRQQLAGLRAVLARHGGRS